MSKELDSVTSETFDEKIRNGLVLIEFGADWCSPCKQLEPRVARMMEELDDIEGYSLDVDENQDIADRFSVRSIPTMLLFRDGEQIDELVGSVPREQFKDFVNDHRE